MTDYYSVGKADSYQIIASSWHEGRWADDVRVTIVIRPNPGSEQLLVYVWGKKISRMKMAEDTGEVFDLGEWKPEDGLCPRGLKTWVHYMGWARKTDFEIMKVLLAEWNLRYGAGSIPNNIFRYLKEPAHETLI